MSYYHTCPDCKANLDPGERCDCKKVKQASCDRLIISFDDAQNDDEAREIYSKLVTQAPEGK
jgi:hypothetical protein